MPDFDPNAAADEDAGIFGLPFTEKESRLVLLPVPWEATTSYGGGTSDGPRAIYEASGQIDLYDPDVFKPYEPGIFMRPESKDVRAWSKAAKAQAKKVIAAGGVDLKSKALVKAAAEVDRLGAKMNDWVYRETKALLKAGKIVGLVGGDHSVPYGAFKAAAEELGGYGLLHFDAHSDTRKAYEGFRWSHASIMRNAMQDVPAISRIVQVGIRDYCEEEQHFLDSLGHRASLFLDKDLAARRFSGEPWLRAVQDIVDALPDKVWVTFDIDGLDPVLCPGTGTPVPGGLQFQEVNFLLGALARSGRTIVGFDLVEVSPSGRDEWDANVGMRLLYKLIAWTFVSRGLCRTR